MANSFVRKASRPNSNRCTNAKPTPHLARTHRARTLTERTTHKTQDTQAYTQCQHTAGTAPGLRALSATSVYGTARIRGGGVHSDGDTDWSNGFKDRNAAQLEVPGSKSRGVGWYNLCRGTD